MTALRPPVVSRAEPEIVDRVDAAGLADMTELARLAAARYGIAPDSAHAPVPADRELDLPG